MAIHLEHAGESIFNRAAAVEQARHETRERRRVGGAAVRLKSASHLLERELLAGEALAGLRGNAPNGRVDSNALAEPVNGFETPGELNLLSNVL